MSNLASERLRRLNSKIMASWEKRALAEVRASIHQESLALRDSLPEFLNQIDQALSTNVNRTDARVKWDKSESSRVGRKHGRERADSIHYTMDQLIFEYHILRQVLCEIMEEEAPLSSVEREIIICAIEQAVNDAATEFSDTLTDVQNTFTHTLAHDLRSPMSAVKLSAQLLLKNPQDPVRCANIAGRIMRSMERQDQMIQNLLDAGRLLAGEKLRLPLAQCDLDFLMTEIVEDTNFIHGDRLRWASSGPLIGSWNEAGLRRVFENLINNALKFSEIDSPINLKSLRKEKSVEISIQNFGKIIPRDELPVLFERYHRVRKTSDDKTGWGLGLSVVKGISEAHGGSVTVSSDSQNGTVFTVCLPR
jgi:signal transduction histidine kinase